MRDGLRCWCAVTLVMALLCGGHVLCAEEVTVRQLPQPLRGYLLDDRAQTLLPGVYTERLEVVNRGSRPAEVEITLRLNAARYAASGHGTTVETSRREEVPPDGLPHIITVRTPLAKNSDTRTSDWHGDAFTWSSEVRVNGRPCPLEATAGKSAGWVLALPLKTNGEPENRLMVSSLLAQEMQGNWKRQALVAGQPASEWPEDTLAFMGMPSVWLTPAEWRELRDGTRSALRAYQRLGGQIFICATVRQATLPPWETLHTVLSQEGLGRTVELSDIRCLEALLSHPYASKTVAQHELTSRMLTLLSRPLPQRLMGSQLERRLHAEASERLAPLPMAIVLLLTLLALGPGVMGWCCWRGRPLRALLLTPPLAALAALAILVCDRLRLPPARSQLLAVTCLDQTRGEHSSYGLVSLLALKGLEEDISFPVDGRLELYWQRADVRLRQQGDRLVSDDGLLNSGLPTQYGVYAAGPAEARLDLSFDGDGRCHVVNRLGVNLKELCVVAPNGQLYAGGELPPGAAGTLAPTPASPQAMARTQAGLEAFLQQLGDGPDTIPRLEPFAGALPPGSYVGLSDQTLLVEPGMRIAEGKVRQVVFGSFGASETKEVRR